jgi:hypothetical protein
VGRVCELGRELLSELSSDGNVRAMITPPPSGKARVRKRHPALIWGFELAGTKPTERNDWKS